MPCIKLVLAIDVRQRHVIRMEYKGLGLKIMTPMFESLNNGIELLVIGGVVQS